MGAEIKDYQNTEELIQNMTDAGCSELMISRFCDCITQGDKKESLYLLEKRREELLNEIRESKSCIEFLNEELFRLKEENQ